MKHIDSIGWASTLRCLPGLLAILGGVHSDSLSACSDNEAAVGTENYFALVYGDRPTKEQLSNLGRKIFFDTSLSASGKLACSSCHSPGHAFGPPGGLAVVPGGTAMNRTGFRNTPSLTYLHSPTAFTEHFYETEVTGGKDDEGPTGGRTWDGRVNTGHDQALMPLLDQNEMANADVNEVYARLKKAAYSEEFRQALSSPGENVLDNVDATIAWLTVALETFEQSQAEFHPFTSKYDAYIKDQARLTAQEKRGLALFTDMKKGNCASCHPSDHKSPASHLPIFTDFGFVATGAPRNPTLAANADPKFFDLGLCGPLRTDLKSHPDYCGSFRTPSLRNVAERKNFFHNGVFHSLRQVVDFYVTRDITPEKWYPRGPDGKVRKYDDLPVQYHANVNADIPFKPLPGNKPRLSPSEIDDVVAFLKTLSDGYTKFSVKKQP